MAEAGMPKNAAQWTGFAVTLIIVLGRDADVLTAVPLGIAAGMLATLFQAALSVQPRPVRFFLGPRPSSPRRRGPHRETTTDSTGLRHAEAAPVAQAGETPAIPGKFNLNDAVTSVMCAMTSLRPKRRHAQFRE
jgi:hypothetical protein